MHVARRGDLTMFEYLLQHGAVVPAQGLGRRDFRSIAAMLQRHQNWIDQAAALARRWHLPLATVRAIHENLIGFNWSAVSESLTHAV